MSRLQVKMLRDNLYYLLYIITTVKNVFIKVWENKTHIQAICAEQRLMTVLLLTVLRRLYLGFLLFFMTLWTLAAEAYSCYFLFGNLQQEHDVVLASYQHQSDVILTCAR